MNADADAWKKLTSRRHVREANSESPCRWLIQCISCDAEVEPWQTIGYQHGYCKDCFQTIMSPMGRS